jgi:hypothetical protein
MASVLTIEKVMADTFLLDKFQGCEPKSPLAGLLCLPDWGAVCPSFAASDYRRATSIIKRETGGGGSEGTQMRVCKSTSPIRLAN